MEFQMF